MHYRIGLNVGDVAVEGERIYGDGVNIAARIESLAEGGGVSISGTVYDQVKNKLALSYAYQGEQSVKNIVEPVRVWRVVMDEAAAALAATQSMIRQASAETHGGGTAHRLRIRWPKGAMVLMSLLLLVGVIVSVQYLSLRLPTPSAKIPPAQPPLLPLPDKPSIAVLPFTNMSGDPEQEYFSDGMTETLITDLSKISGLFVIARNSTFAYKGKAVKVEQVGRELGVRHVLEGSVQRADQRVRINAQLIDVTTGGHVWADRYDRQLQDIFTLQDEITRKIAFALKVKLTPDEQERFRRVPTDNLEAYDCVLRGTTYHFHFTKDGNAQARQLYEKALELDPKYAGAYALLGDTYFQDWISQWSPDPQNPERAWEFVQKAIVLDDSLSLSHLILGNLYLWKNRQHELAVTEVERAIALAPNDATAYMLLAWIFIHAGRPEEAIEKLEKAMRLDPHYPVHCLIFLGEAYWWLGRNEEAIASEKKALLRNPDDLGAHLRLAVFYAESGREEEAHAEIEESLRLSPNYSLEVVRQITPYKNPADLERVLTALHKAGLK
ncbi:MAG: adenylate/guanylate cyclase domain-containing protein [Candidatus Binatia bacterium]